MKTPGLKAEWSTEQQTAIQLLAEGGHSYEEIAPLCKVSTHTIYNWRKDPRFMDEVIARARQLLKHNLPDIYNSLIHKAKKGNPRHIELVLKHLEKLEEMKAKYAENSITFTWEAPYVDNNS